MNRIDPEIESLAIERFILQNASVREVCRDLGISRGTATRIQKECHMVDFEFYGYTRVNTGRRKDGSMSFYYTKEIRDHWKPLDSTPPAVP